MRHLLLALLPLLVVQSTILAAGGKCAPMEPGQFHPWQTNEIMPDDKYADVYIDVDEKGGPLKCYIGKTNIQPDNRFWACKAFMDDWHTMPLTKDGKAVRGTVTRHFIMFGDKHIAADRKRRKQWFLDHPSERPNCYPE